MFHKLKIFLFAAFILTSSMVFPDEFRMEKYKAFDHFNSENIVSGMQDNNGFIWFSTAKGLYKFNGKKIEKIHIPQYDKEKKIFNSE